jgi:hypothetical protein
MSSCHREWRLIDAEKFARLSGVKSGIQFRVKLIRRARDKLIVLARGSNGISAPFESFFLTSCNAIKFARSFKMSLAGGGPVNLRC